MLSARPAPVRNPLPSWAHKREIEKKSSSALKKILMFAVDFVLPKSGCIRTNAFAMNKAELIESIQKALGADATKRAAEQALDAVFEVKKRAARLGRNPKTGEALKIAASKSVGFKASSVLKGSL
jgi:DNA-binding protein HU-beta